MKYLSITIHVESNWEASEHITWRYANFENASLDHNIIDRSSDGKKLDDAGVISESKTLYDISDLEILTGFIKVKGGFNLNYRD